MSPSNRAVTPFATLLTRHVSWLEASRYAASTVRSRRRDLRAFADWCASQGIVAVRDVTLPLLEEYRVALHRRRKADGAPLGCGTQAQKLLAVKRFLHWAARMHVVESDLSREVVLPRRPQTLPRQVLTASEAERVLHMPDVTTAKGVRDRAILETLYSTGIRRLELIQLALGDVGMESGLVFVRNGKGGKDRVVPISERALAWIRRYCEQARPALLRPCGAGRLFVGPRGGPMRPNQLSEMVRGYVRAAGTGKAGSCHLLRHTAATLMLEHGADVRAIQELLGHAQLNTTALYTRVSVSHLKRVHERTHPGCQAGPAGAAVPPPSASAPQAPHPCAGGDTGST